MATVNTEKLLEELKKYANADSLTTLINGFNATDGAWGKIKYVQDEVLPYGAALVEKLALDLNFLSSGEDKKAALVKFLDDLIDLPFYLEPFDGMVFGFLIDLLVGQWNELYGKEWFQNIVESLGFDFSLDS